MGIPRPVAVAVIEDNNFAPTRKVFADKVHHAAFRRDHWRTGRRFDVDSCRPFAIVERAETPNNFSANGPAKFAFDMKTAWRRGAPDGRDADLWHAQDLANAKGSRILDMIGRHQVADGNTIFACNGVERFAFPDAVRSC